MAKADSGGRPGAAAPAAAGAAAAAPAAGDEWRLYYWPSVKGRGEYVRLCFEEAGVPYTDVAYATPGSPSPAAFAAAAGDPASPPDWGSVGKTPGFQAIVDFCFTHGADGTHAPVRAPPAVARGGGGGGGFVLCNTPAVCSYLNDAFGWGAGLSREQRAVVDQVLSVILSDAVAEGRLAFHPVQFYASHRLQVDKCGPYIEEYGTKRLPKYIQFLEALLEWNQRQLAADSAAGTAAAPAAPAAAGFLVGPGLTAADLVAWHYCCACARHYPGHYEAAVASAPRVAAFKAAIAARPRIAAYLASDRCPPWDKDSLM